MRYAILSFVLVLSFLAGHFAGRNSAKLEALENYNNLTKSIMVANAAAKATERIIEVKQNEINNAVASNRALLERLRNLPKPAENSATQNEQIPSDEFSRVADFAIRVAGEADRCAIEVEELSRWGDGLGGIDD